jgi:predicted nucleotidyltransferase
MVTKTQLKILAYLIDNQEKHLGIRELAREISTVYYLVQKNVQQLKEKKAVILHQAGKTSLVKLHPQIDPLFLTEAEIYKRKLFYQRHPNAKIILKKIIRQAKSCFFVLLVFGSYTKKPRKDSDLDLLVIVPSQKQVEVMERIISTIAGISTLKIHETVVAEKSFHSMLTRKELNVAHEVIQRHVLIYGDQLYYKLIEK